MKLKVTLLGAAVLLLITFTEMTLFAHEDKGEVNRLDEVVVTGTRTEHTLKDVPVETLVITHDDIEKTNAQTVTEALKSVTGLSAAGADDVFGAWSSTARLHGLSFNNGYGLVLIDGQRVHGSGQSGAHGEYAIGLNQIPISMIERIEIVKGPSSVLYGSDAMVGVINIITHKTPKKAIGGAGASYGWYTVGSQTRSGVTTKPSDDGEFRHLTENYVYYGDRINDTTGYMLNYSFESGESNGSDPIESKRNSIMAKLDSRLSDQVNVDVKGEVSAFERGGSSTSVEDSHRISAGVTYTPSEDHLISVKGYHYVDYFDAESSASHRIGEIGFNQMEMQYTLNQIKNHQLTAGLEFQRQVIDYYMDNFNDADDPSDDTRTTVKEDVDTFSIYLQDEITLFNDLVLVPGIRLDSHSTFDESVNPKLSAMYRIHENTTIRASVGKSFKSPTIRQLYYDVPYYHSPFYIQSNPDLDPETAIGATIGIEQWLSNNNIILTLGYFRNDIDDMVVTEISDELYNGQQLYIYKNVDEAMTQGVEFTARMQLGRDFLLHAGYTYTDSEDKSTGEELTYVPEHEVYLNPVYEYQPLQIGTSVNAVYYSKQSTGSAADRKIGSHMVVDAQVYKWLSPRAKLSLEADNIFDADKEDERSYRIERVFTLNLDINF